MRLIGFLAGLILVLIILWDTFETVILPRRVTRRIKLTSLFYSSAWRPWALVMRRITNSRTQEQFLGLFGPMSLLVLLAIWAFCLILGFGLLLWSTSPRINNTPETLTFWSYLYLSGVTFFTLGYGDLVPASSMNRFLAVVEAANGFGLIAIVVSYLPVLYQAFSRRETSISLLDARAGSPSSAVELLRRHRAENGFDELKNLLTEWERWSAELLESHLSYPVLCYFRSQHDNQSWLRALTTVLDTCALVMVGVRNGPAWQARMTFAMARHAVVDIAQVFKTKPIPKERCGGRLPAAELERVRAILAQNGIYLPEDQETEERLSKLRAMYEPYVFALSELLLMPLPPWILPPDAIDNWKTSAWGRIQ